MIYNKICTYNIIYIYIHTYIYIFYIIYYIIYTILCSIPGGKNHLACNIPSSLIKPDWNITNHHNFAPRRISNPQHMEMSVPLSVSITLPKSKSKPWTLLWKIQTCSDKISPNWRKHVKTSRIRQTKANAKSTVKPTQYNPNEVSQKSKNKKNIHILKITMKSLHRKILSKFHKMHQHSTTTPNDTYTFP